MTVTAETTGLVGLTERHPGVRHFGPLFAYGHLPPHLAEMSARFATLAAGMIDACLDGPELATALRKLVEAKDCAVRQIVIDNVVNPRGRS